MLRAAARGRALAGLLGGTAWNSSSCSSSGSTGAFALAAQAAAGAAARNSSSSSSNVGGSCRGPPGHQARRLFASEAGDGDYTSEVDAINEKFVEAREEIEYAREDAETVYFNESAEAARAAVADVLARWQGLLARLPEEEQAKLQRSMGLKIEQLRAELKEMDELHA